MNFDFAGKRILVTGGASGIGRETAEMFGRTGGRVVVADISGDDAREVADLIRDAGGEAYPVEVDVTNADANRAMVEEAVARLGGLDIAVNSAGIGGARAKTADYDLEVWDRIIAVNLTGVWYSMRYELPAMLESGGGAIVNLASIAGVIGFASASAYAASKHGVIGLTRSAALEYARSNIRINAVCPAFTRTPMVDRMLTHNPSVEPRLEAAIPMGRFGKPGEIADSILYLCSDAASFITGHSLLLDGGLSVG